MRFQARNGHKPPFSVINWTFFPWIQILILLHEATQDDHIRSLYEFGTDKKTFGCVGSCGYAPASVKNQNRLQNGNIYNCYHYQRQTFFRKMQLQIEKSGFMKTCDEHIHSRLVAWIQCLFGQTADRPNLLNQTPPCLQNKTSCWLEYPFYKPVNRL